MATIGLSYVAPYLGPTLIQIPITIWSMVGGPLLGVFLLGVFFPFGNSIVSVKHSLASICQVQADKFNNTCLFVHLFIYYFAFDLRHCNRDWSVCVSVLYIHLEIPPNHYNYLCVSISAFTLQGAVFGLLGSLGVSLWLGAGSIMYGSPQQPLPLNISYCSSNITHKLFDTSIQTIDATVTAER